MQTHFFPIKNQSMFVVSHTSFDKNTKKYQNMSLINIFWTEIRDAVVPVLVNISTFIAT